LVISNDQLNKAGDLVCIQITSKIFTDECYFELSDFQLTIPLKLKSGIRLQKLFTVHSGIAVQKISEATPVAFLGIIEALNQNVIRKA